MVILGEKSSVLQTSLNHGIWEVDKMHMDGKSVCLWVKRRASLFLQLISMEMRNFATSTKPKNVTFYYPQTRVLF